MCVEKAIPAGGDKPRPYICRVLWFCRGGLYAHPLSIHRKLPSSGAAQWHLNELARGQNRTPKTPGSEIRKLYVESESRIGDSLA